MPTQEICSAAIYLVSKNLRNITILGMCSENGMTCCYKPDHLCDSSPSIFSHGGHNSKVVSEHCDFSVWSHLVMNYLYSNFGVVPLCILTIDWFEPMFQGD
jgi:hypothetical protein